MIWPSPCNVPSTQTSQERDSYIIVCLIEGITWLPMTQNTQAIYFCLILSNIITIKPSIAAVLILVILVLFHTAAQQP